MLQKRWRTGCVTVLLLLWLTGVRAQANVFGPVSVTLLRGNSHENRAFGYYQYRFRLVNGGALEHRVRLRMPAISGVAYGPCLAGISGTFHLPAHSSRVVSLFQPCLPLAGNGLSVWIDGRRQQGMIQTPQLRVEQYGGQASATPILLSSGVNEKIYGRLAWLAGGASARLGQLTGVHPSPPRLGVYRSGQPVERWSGHWLGYSSYAGLVITQADLHAMPPRVRLAIWGYVQCGGTLLLLNGKKSDVPSAWQKWSRFGRGQTVGGSNALSSMACKAFPVGFGLCLEAPQRRVARWNNADWAGFSQVCNQPIATLSMHSPATANGVFAVVRNLALPARSLLVILAIFAVMVGPVNLLMLGFWRKRPWLWITTPAIALLFAAGVFVYTAAVQGWSGVRRVTAFTILNQADHQATTIGWIGYYTPLTPSAGLHFDRQVELLPEAGWGWDESQGNFDPMVNDQGDDVWRPPPSYRYISWTKGQNLTVGWVAARVPTLFALRKDAPSQAHIAIWRDSAGHITAVNDLGSPVELVWYADGTGDLFRGGPLLPGVKTQLTAMGHLPTGPCRRNLRDIFLSQFWPTAIAAVAGRSGTNLLHPHCYLAVLNHSPFVGPGLRGTRLRPAPSVVYGVGLEATDAR